MSDKVNTKIERDFSQVIKNLDGTSVRTGASVQAFARAIDKADLSSEAKLVLQKALVEEAGKELTLAEAALIALQQGFEDEKNLSGEDRMKRLMLGMRIVEGGVTEITAEERDLIKKVICKMFTNHFVVGNCLLMLEGEVK